MRWNELCQPCGDCQWCRSNARAKRERAELRRELRRVKALLAAARDAIRDELYAAGDEEARHHPVLLAHERVVRRIERWLVEHDPALAPRDVET